MLLHSSRIFFEPSSKTIDSLESRLWPGYNSNSQTHAIPIKYTEFERVWKFLFFIFWFLYIYSSFPSYSTENENRIKCISCYFIVCENVTVFFDIYWKYDFKYIRTGNKILGVHLYLNLCSIIIIQFERHVTMFRGQWYNNNVIIISVSI